MSDEQVKTGLDVKKTKYALAIFAFLFGLSMAYLTFADVINLQTFFVLTFSAGVVLVIMGLKFRGTEKEQKKQEKEDNPVFPHYEQEKKSLDVTKTRNAAAIIAFLFGLLMVYLTYTYIINLQTFFLIMTSALVVEIIISFRLRGIEKERKKEKANSIASA